MNNKIVIGLLVLLVGVAAGWYFLGGGQPQPGPAPQPPETSQPLPATGSVGEETVVTPATGAGEAMEKGGVSSKTVVRYTDSGFNPATITVKKGATVSFVNEASGGMWVASAVHPTHQLLPGFDQLKSVAKGGTYDYAFTKVGTWKYHNHVAPNHTGSVVVTE